jgi:type IV pilus assembly protein PilE
MKHQQRLSGFTLVELMIAVAVMAILAAIAVPAYNNYKIKANRSAAQQFMLSVANRQEQYLLDNRSYATTIAELGLAAPSELAGKYNTNPGDWIINVTTTPPAFTVQAIPAGIQAGDGTLTLTNTGAKGPAGKW